MSLDSASCLHHILKHTSGDHFPSEALVPEARRRTEVTGQRSPGRLQDATDRLLRYEHAASDNQKLLRASAQNSVSNLNVIAVKTFRSRMIRSQSDSEETIHPSRPDCFFSPEFLPLRRWLVTQLCSVCILNKLFISFSLRFNQIIQRAPTCWCSSKKVNVVVL